MTKTIAQRGPAIRLRTLSLAALGTAVVVTGAAVVPELFSDDDALPSDVGVDTPLSYTITYLVKAGNAVTTDVLTVQRPFASHLTTHAGDSANGRVLSQRASELGVLATSSGGAWGRLVVPPAVATADLRPDAALDAAVGAGIVKDLGASSVGGRACRRYATATSIAAGTLEVPKREERAEVCIDAVGIVLEERWVIDGEEVRTKRATALSFDRGARLRVPDGSLLPGSGDLRQLADNAASPFSNTVTVGAVPEGFEHVGRYAVVPPDLSVDRNANSSAAAKLATITDVWVRGADTLIVDQGATTGGDPFARTEIAAPVNLEMAGLGDAVLVLDLRASEIRIRLDDGGFVRVAATLPPEDLMAVARSLTLAKRGQ